MRWPKGVVVAVMLVAACKCGGGVRTPGKCSPVVQMNKDHGPADVEDVRVYWDVSSSMQGYTKTGGGLTEVWQQLDRRWIRDGNLSIKSVSHFGIGADVTPLTAGRALPPLSARWTNLPVAAYQIGELVTKTEGEAAIIISDMLVDSPPGAPGQLLCGSIPIPAGRGDVPSLVGQCLGETWKSAHPDYLDVRLVSLRQAAPPKGPEPRPLFMLVVSRNAEFASRLIENVQKGASAGTTVSSVVLVSHRPKVECGGSGVCSYLNDERIVARHASQTRVEDCSFFVPSSVPGHSLNCDVPKPVAEPAIVSTTLGDVIPTGRGQVTFITEGHGTTAARYIRAKLLLTQLPSGTTSNSYGLQFIWSLSPDAAQLITNGVGGSWGADAEYQTLFVTIARVAQEAIRPSTCDRTWSIPYSH